MTEKSLFLYKIGKAGQLLSRFPEFVMEADQLFRVDRVGRRTTILPEYVCEGGKIYRASRVGKRGSVLPEMWILDPYIFLRSRRSYPAYKIVPPKDQPE